MKFHNHKMFLSILLVLCVAAMPTAVMAKHDNDHGKGNKANKHVKHQVKYIDRDILREAQRADIRRLLLTTSAPNRIYYRDLPPGIQKRLVRGKPLPPGIAKQITYLPRDYNQRLGFYNRDYRLGVYGNDVFVQSSTTGLILDILYNVLAR